MRPDLTVIVVTWNVREPVLACLEALTRRAQNTTLEVIVVDNASSDGTVEAVAETFPTVRIIENTENVGFPRANNQALWLARGRHVLFLNPDTIVGEGTLAACLRELDHDPEIAMVGCRLVYPDGRLQKECARRHYRLRHLLWEAFYLQIRFPDHPIFADQMMGSWDHEGRRDVEALTGAFMMVRKTFGSSGRGDSPKTSSCTTKTWPFAFASDARDIGSGILETSSQPTCMEARLPRAH